MFSILALILRTMDLMEVIANEKWMVDSVFTQILS